MIFYYSHDISGGNRTGITKVGLSTLRVLNFELNGFTVISSPSMSALQKSLNTEKINFKLFRSRLRWEYMNKWSQRMLAKGVNLFRRDVRNLNLKSDDIIIFNHIEFDDGFLDFCKSCKGKKIAWIHGTPEAFLAEERTAILINRIVEVYNQMDIVIHLNNESKIGWNNYGIDSKAIILPNTISEISPSLTSTERIEVLIIGTITKRKGFSLLLDILENFDLPFNVSIIGKDPKTEYSKEVLEKVNKSKSVTYLGSVPNAISYIRSAKVIWCLSEGEGQSLALLESLFSGKPIISTRFPGIEDIVIEGKNGHIIDSSVKENFIQKTVEVLGDNNIEYGLRSHELYKSRFSNEVYAKRLMDILRYEFGDNS